MYCDGVDRYVFKDVRMSLAPQPIAMTTAYDAGSYVAGVRGKLRLR